MATESRSPYQNQVLGRAIESRYHTVYRFCKAENLDLVSVTSLLCGTMLPVNGNRKFTLLAKKLMEIFQIPSHELFPAEFYCDAEIADETMPSAQSDDEADSNPLLQIIGSLHPFKREEVFTRAALTFFEREVVCRRHNLDEDFPGYHTYQAISRSLRQVKSTAELKHLEAAAVRKLRKALRALPNNFF